MTVGHIVRCEEGEIRDLGIIKMRVLADGRVSDGQLAVLEFIGGEGPWTVPHVHNETEESFYVLAGTFDFICAEQEITLSQGDYLLVPRGTAHMITAHPGGGTLLGINAPAGLEDMFRELSQLPADSVRDPATRREISQKFDAVPV
ncbi:MAG: cupin domain-containing protein [Actinomycetota bacterium]|nr:cupin domain-containing protein [Actinomycetota bacterium]